jgi:hypothetical protein
MSSHVHLSSQQIPVTALETQEEGCKVEPDISEQLNITPRDDSFFFFFFFLIPQGQTV